MSVRTVKDIVTVTDTAKSTDILFPEGRNGRSIIGALASVFVSANASAVTTTFDIFGLTRVSDGTLKETAAVLATQISFATGVTGHVAFAAIENDGAPVVVDGFRLKMGSAAHAAGLTYEFRVEFIIA